MSYCDGIIAKDLNPSSCSTRAAKGFEQVGIILNRSDIDFSKVSFSAEKKNVLTALGLLKGKKGYRVAQHGQTPFTGTNSSAEVGTYGTGVNNNVVFAVLNNDQDTSENVIDSLLNGEFVMILEMKDKGEGNNSAFRVYGLHQGLHLSAYEHDPYGDTYGGGLVTLTETDAPMSALYLGDTYAAGKTLFDSFLAPAA